MKYKYEIIRSARKTISVKISCDNKITVSCPWGMRVAEIEKFLDDKKDWIEKVVLNNSVRLAQNDDVLEYRQIYVGGKRLKLIFSDKNAIEDGCVFIKSKNDVERLFVNEFSESFNARVQQLAKNSKLYPNSVSVKGYKGRWGCCDAKNNLIFNYKLFMLPCELQDYVIVHELCHTICRNHSDAFWHLVEEFVPDCKKKRKDLQYYDFITGLY